MTTARLLLMMINMAIGFGLGSILGNYWDDMNWPIRVISIAGILAVIVGISMIPVDA